MSRRAEPLSAGVHAPDTLQRLFAGGWPPFISADKTAEQLLPRIRKEFKDLELAVVDNGELAAAGWAVPVAWSGAAGDLPGGYTDTLARALEALDRRVPVNTLVVCAAQVRPDLHRRGLATTLLHAFIGLRRALGLQAVIAPLRPTLKERYPLIPIDTYAAWKRDDGEPFDPWLRTHVRMGAKVIATVPASQTMTGTVADWEDWTGMALPGTGLYVIPSGLSPLHVDRDKDLGTYSEPGIWIQHR